MPFPLATGSRCPRHGGRERVTPERLALRSPGRVFGVDDSRREPALSPRRSLCGVTTATPMGSYANLDAETVLQGSGKVSGGDRTYGPAVQNLLAQPEAVRGPAASLATDTETTSAGLRDAPTRALPGAARARLSRLAPALRNSLTSPYRLARARRTGSGPADRARPVGAADLNQARLLALLGRGTLTIGEMSERGIDAPAQAVYDLQLVGHVIERAPVRDESGQRSLRYRLVTNSRAPAQSTSRLQRGRAAESATRPPSGNSECAR